MQDSNFEALLAERQREIEEVQRRDAARLQEVERRGQETLSNERNNLPKELGEFIANQEDGGVAVEDSSGSFDSNITGSNRDLSARSPHPSLFYGSGSAESSVGWITPYHGKLIGSDGKVLSESYNPGNFNYYIWAKGGGTGIAGTGAGSGTGYIDWWFAYTPPTNRHYAHEIWVPYYGFYRVEADDGWLTSKFARVRISLEAYGYQYNGKSIETTNVLEVEDDNIHTGEGGDRYDGWRKMYYGTLFGGVDRAYIRVTTKLHVYARGGGSYAELNFASGNANYVGVPIINVT